MAKQCYESKRTTKVIGTLDKLENGEYIITVEDKENIQEYELTSILDSMLGTVVTILNEENI